MTTTALETTPSTWEGIGGRGIGGREGGREGGVMGGRVIERVRRGGGYMGWVDGYVCR